jgi:hypothetical protein
MGSTDVQGFYRTVLRTIWDEQIPALIGGAYALGLHTELHRETKDLDLFVLPRDCPLLLQRFAGPGLQSRLVARHWLGKICFEDALVDLIFGLRNGMDRVDESWFEHAVEGKLFGVPVRILAPEEMIWSKAFVMERDRYDGADIAHLFRSKAAVLDWDRLLGRFGPNWLLLLNYLVLFRFIYPEESRAVPGALMEELLRRWRRAETSGSMPGAPLCRGTLLSFTQYLDDVDRLGYRDARLPPIGTLTPGNILE